MTKLKVNATTGQLDLVNDFSSLSTEGEFKYTKSLYQPLCDNLVPTTENIPGNTLCSKKIQVEEDVVVDEIAVRTNISYPGETFVLGLYALDYQGLPDSLIVQTTEYDANISGFQSKTIPSTTLTKGVYVVAYLGSAEISFRVNSNSLTNPNFGFDFGGSGLTLNTYRSSLTYTSTLPASFPTGVFQSKGFPLTVFKLS